MGSRRIADGTHRRLHHRGTQTQNQRSAAHLMSQIQILTKFSNPMQSQKV